MYLKQKKEALADFEKALELAESDSEKQEIFNYIQICKKK
jgi:predicted RNA polymerase sigma factor